MIMNRLQPRQVDTRKIRRLMLQTDCPTALQLDIPTATRAQQDCQRRYKLHKDNQAALREAFHLTVSERRALKYGTSVETQHKITQNAFCSKWTFSIIRSVHQKNTRAAITYVEHTNQDNIEVECFDRSAIDATCIQEGRQRYSQAHNTSFLTTPLVEDFGFLGNQSTIDNVLNGTYECPSDIDICTQKFLHELQRPPSINARDSINDVATTTEHIQGWKKMRSGTAASTFGPSFSELIAATDDLRVAEVDAVIVSIQARTGYMGTR
jgi:hypothetical protein